MIHRRAYADEPPQGGNASAELDGAAARGEVVERPPLPGGETDWQAVDWASAFSGLPARAGENALAPELLDTAKARWPWFAGWHWHEAMVAQAENDALPDAVLHAAAARSADRRRLKAWLDGDLPTAQLVLPEPVQGLTAEAVRAAALPLDDDAVAPAPQADGAPDAEATADVDATTDADAAPKPDAAPSADAETEAEPEAPSALEAERVPDATDAPDLNALSSTIKAAQASILGWEPKGTDAPEEDLSAAPQGAVEKEAGDAEEHMDSPVQDMDQPQPTPEAAEIDQGAAPAAAPQTEAEPDAAPIRPSALEAAEPEQEPASTSDREPEPAPSRAAELEPEPSPGFATEEEQEPGRAHKAAAIATAAKTDAGPATAAPHSFTDWLRNLRGAEAQPAPQPGWQDAAPASASPEPPASTTPPPAGTAAAAMRSAGAEAAHRTKLGAEPEPARPDPRDVPGEEASPKTRPLEPPRFDATEDLDALDGLIARQRKRTAQSHGGGAQSSTEGEQTGTSESAAEAGTTVPSRSSESTKSVPEAPAKRGPFWDDSSPAGGPMTLTWARILTEQGKIPEAIAVYEALALRHPEKSGYFAALIQELKAR